MCFDCRARHPKQRQPHQQHRQQQKAQKRKWNWMWMRDKCGNDKVKLCTCVPLCDWLKEEETAFGIWHSVCDAFCLRKYCIEINSAISIVCAPAVCRLVVMLHTFIAFTFAMTSSSSGTQQNPPAAQWQASATKCISVCVWQQLTHTNCKPKSPSPPKDKSDYMITHVSVAITPFPLASPLPSPESSKSFTCCKYDVLDAFALKTKTEWQRTEQSKQIRGYRGGRQKKPIIKQKKWHSMFLSPWWRCAPLGLLVVDGYR